MLTCTYCGAEIVPWRGGHTFQAWRHADGSALIRCVDGSLAELIEPDEEDWGGILVTYNEVRGDGWPRGPDGALRTSDEKLGGYLLTLGLGVARKVSTGEMVLVGDIRCSRCLGSVLVKHGNAAARCGDCGWKWRPVTIPEGSLGIVDEKRGLRFGVMR